MRNSETDLTIILPCAGSGARLGLANPKELFEIVPNLRLIDLSLAHIRAAPAGLLLQARLAVVIRGWKQEVVDYVRQKLPEVKVDAVMFDDAFREWPGSIYSAREVFSRYNLVMLPDSLLNLGCSKAQELPVCRDADGFSLVEVVVDALLKHKLVFGYVQCSYPSVLKNLGALRVKNGLVTGFQDKPRQSFEHYNGFWGCCAFRKEVGKALYNFLIRSVLHQPVSLEAQPFYPPGAIPLASYQDLGTWDAIKKFRQDYYRSK